MKRQIIPLLAIALQIFSANAETYHLIGQRHLRLYTASAETQAYNASIDAQKVADELCTVPWARARSVGATSTSHVNDQLDSNVANRDQFDAALFCAEHTNGTHRAYANAAVYRYRLPDGQLPNITRLEAKVSSDPYNAFGARIVLYTNGTGEIPTDCTTCRGENQDGIKLIGIAPRITRSVDGKDYWYPNTTNAVFTQSVQLQRYLFVFVLLENYSTSRGNWLEGCSWIDNSIEITTDAPVPGWENGSTIDLSQEAEDDSGNGIRADSDNDGITDYRERLSSTVLTNIFRTPVVDPGRMMTYPGQLVPDYFLPAGTNYIGSLLTDHDFIEDWLEDSDELFVGDRKASRYRHDAYDDNDDNGWDNWSEARAFIENQAAYQGRPCPNGRIKVIYNGARAFTGKIIVQAYHYRNGQVPPIAALTDETWTFPVKRKNSWYELRSSSDSYLRQGKNMFVVYNDADMNGAWTPGEPYGVVTDVDVGYSRISDATVEITDVNSSMMRIDLRAATANNTFDGQKGVNDRGVNMEGVFSNEAASSNALTVAVASSGKIRVRVVRMNINGNVTSWKESHTIHYVAAPVIEKEIDLEKRPFLTEADLMQEGLFDLDWGNFNDSYNKWDVSFGALFKVGYAILIGDEVFNPASIENAHFLATMFYNGFEAGSAQTKAVPKGIVSDKDVCPTFTWEHHAMINGTSNDMPFEKSYPAFRLRVWDGSTLVYDSGVRRAPMRDSNGCYIWKAPDLFVGVSNAGTGIVLENNKKYTYTVSMLDAKFTNVNSGETPCEFTMKPCGEGGDISDQYSIPTAVKYFGSADTNATIRVEAFESPDFAGLPASVTTVTNFCLLAATDSLVPNAALIGLEANKPYFIRAFLDSNANCAKDENEPWGYANYVGSLHKKDIYTPRPFSVKKGSSVMTQAVVFMEDSSDVVPIDLSLILPQGN